MRCNKCGAEIIDGAKFCGECGAVVEVTTKKCEYCGAELPKEATFCSECGKPLNKEERDNEKEIIEERQNEVSQRSSKESSGVSTKTKIIIGIVALAVLICLLFIFIRPGGNNNEQNLETPVANEENNYEYETSMGSESDIEMVRSGYTVFEGEDEEYGISYGLEIKNVSDSLADKGLTVKVTARDDSGSVIETNEEDFTISIPAGEIFGIGGAVEYLNKKPETVEISMVYDPSWESASNRTLLETSDIRIEKNDEESFNIVGDVINNSEKDLSAGECFILYKDASDEIVGGSIAYVEPVNKGKNAFSKWVEDYMVISDKFDAYAIGFDR